jgi:glycosylphosphatidylinositol transamidase (GPIT) subunit GPI8
MYEDTDFELGPAVIKDCEYISQIYSDYNQRLYKDITKTNFIKVLKTYLSYEYDDLVIYFNGHGSQVKSSDNSSEEDGKDEVLIFKKTPSPNATQEIRTMKDYELTELISKNKCKHILMIFDCCHSNTLIDSDDIPSNVSCLYSCKESEVSFQTVSVFFIKFLFEN